MKENEAPHAAIGRIGILGGTFNPIHNAHLQLARLARDAASLDLVLLMVAADPPHKRVSGAVEARERLRMTQLACIGETRIEASDIELMREGKSYTRDTLLDILRLYPNATPYLILGSDMLCDLPNWYRTAEVLEMADVLCIARRGQADGDAEAAQALERRYGARITFVEGDADALSSTLIRQRLYDALPVCNMLPEAVEKACYESGLYAPSDVRELCERMRETLTWKRYVHVAGTMRAAASLAALWRQDVKKARLAALLHDCAKGLDPDELSALSDDETGIAAVQHAFAGAALARMAYGVTDEAVLSAIRLHTTGDAGMSDLDALVYAADIVEPNRTFSGVEAYRAHLMDGPDGFMLYALQSAVAQLTRKGRAIHPATLRALAYYQNKASINKTEEEN